LKLSSVYIVKNEQDNIEKSINSLKDIVDEIIIVDTGSTDDTIKICKKLNCKIYKYEWENDFSKARNYAISLCSNEIIIFLDADEYFSTPLKNEDKKKIEQYFSQDIDAVGIFETDIDKVTNELHHTSYVYKIIKKNLSFKGSIHEHLYKENEELNIHLTNEIELVHTGYSSEIYRSKCERNLEILNSIENKDTMDYFYIGRENLGLDNYKKADKSFDLFFKCEDYKKCIKNNNIAYLSYFYKIEIMKNLADKYSQEEILKYLLYIKEQIPHIPEIYFYLGVYYFNYDFKKSLKYFEECIKKNEEFKDNHFELNNFLSYQDRIYYYKAKILLYQNKTNEAIQRAIVACMLNKKSIENLGLLLHLLNRQKTKENMELLNKIYKPKSKEDYEFLIRGLENTNLYSEFLNFSIIYNKEHQGGADSLYYAMMLSGNYKEALDSLSKFDNEKKDFIMSVILLYANDKDLFKTYSQNLSVCYRDILHLLIRQDFYGKYHKDKLIDIICKLINYGVQDIPNTIWQYIINNTPSEQFNKIINIYNNNQEYSKSIQLLEYCIYDLKVKNEEYINQYLYTLFISKNYKEFVDKYYSFVKELENKKKNLVYLKFINNKNLDKTHSKIKECLLKELG
jgi:glycosyltransferase involved in cell wall biosynthesis